MTLRSLNGNYLLKGELKQKEEYDLGIGQPIYIAKEYENNLRDRNPQIGEVMALPDENPLNLKVGDRVFVNHMVFYGEIGATSKDYVLQDHVTHNGEKLFSCPVKDIYYNIVDEQLTPVGEILLMEVIEEEEEQSGIYLGTTKRKDRAVVIDGNGQYEKGDLLLVESNALYPLTFNKQDYYRLRASEVMAVVKGEEIIPTKGRIVVKDLIEEKKSVLDLSFMRQVKEVESEVIAIGEGIWEFEVGDIAIRRQSRGLKYNGYTILTIQGKLNDESVWGKKIVKCELTEA